jgi:hypothetical protein
MSARIALMTLKRFLLVCGAAALGCAVAGCTVRYYQSFPSPVSMPNNKGNAIVAGVGYPSYLEYQRRLGKRFDLIAGAGYLQSTSTSTEVFNGDTTKETSTAHMMPYSLGTRFWVTEPGKNGFDFNLFGGYSGAFNNERGPWQQFGADFGVAPGAHAQHFTFSFPVKIGGGRPSSSSAVHNPGSYFYYGVDPQFVFHGEHLGGGFSFGIFGSIGADNSNLLVHYPVNLNAFLTAMF